MGVERTNVAAEAVVYKVAPRSPAGLPRVEWTEWSEQKGIHEAFE